MDYIETDGIFFFVDSWNKEHIIKFPVNLVNCVGYSFEI